MVLARLESEAAQTRNSARAQAQREAADAAALQAKDLEAAQELETRAMERYATDVAVIVSLVIIAPAARATQAEP